MILIIKPTAMNQEKTPYNLDLKAICYPMSLYRASFSRRLIWYKTNHDYPLLLKDYMVNKIRNVIIAEVKKNQKKNILISD